DADAHGDLLADSQLHRQRVIHGHRHANADTGIHRYGDLHAAVLVHANAHPHRHADADADADGHQLTHAVADADRPTDEHWYRHADAVELADAVAHVDDHADENPYPHADADLRVVGPGGQLRRGDCPGWLPILLRILLHAHADGDAVHQR